MEAKKAAREIYDPTKPFNHEIRRLIESTHRGDGPFVVRPLGKRFEIDDSGLSGHSKMPAADGIGTKGLLHWKMNTMEHGAQDAFAMVIDDLMESGHIPVWFLDHIQMQEENQERIFRIIRSLVGLSRDNGIAMCGGETAIVNTLQGFEVGIVGMGYAMRGMEIKPDLRENDVIIGLRSSGVHSNGLSFFRRELLENRGLGLDYILPYGRSIGEELTTPTAVYMPALKELIRKTEGAGERVIRGMVHITGGGISKLGELIGGRDLDVNVSMPFTHSIFSYVQREFSIKSSDMYLRFNNGVGYAIAVPGSYVNDSLAVLRQYFPAEVIGVAAKGNGKVRIRSQYDSETVVY